MSLRATDIVLYLALIVTCVIILRMYNIFGTKKGMAKAEQVIKSSNKGDKDRMKETKRMKFYQSFYKQLGFPIDAHRKSEVDYLLKRNNVRLKALDRFLSAEEFYGKCRLISFIGCFIGFILIITGQLWGIIFLLACFYRKIRELGYNININAEDEMLERDFPSFYLLLHSRLELGVNASLAPIIDNYLLSIEQMYGDKVDLPIKRFAQNIRSNISIYGSDIIALKEIRLMYKSPLIMNFINLAIQSLRGVDNTAKLNTFSMELALITKQERERRQEQIKVKGQRSVYIIYIILIQFVILTLVSKIDVSLITDFLG